MDNAIPIAMNAFLRAMRDAGRGTGRSTLTINSMREGDAVVVVNTSHGKELQRIAHEKGFKILIIVANPLSRSGPPLEIVAERLRGTSQDVRLFFDHHWLEEFYAEQLSSLTGTIGQFRDYLRKEEPKPDEQPSLRVGRYPVQGWSSD